MKWNEMEWNGMEWNEMNLNGINWIELIIKFEGLLFIIKLIS